MWAWPYRTPTPRNSFGFPWLMCELYFRQMVGYSGQSHTPMFIASIWQDRQAGQRVKVLGPQLLAVFDANSIVAAHWHGAFSEISLAISKSSQLSTSSVPFVLNACSMSANSLSVKRLICSSGIGGKEKYREVCKKLGTVRPSLGGLGAFLGMLDRLPQVLQINPTECMPSPSHTVKSWWQLLQWQW